MFEISPLVRGLKKRIKGAKLVNTNLCDACDEQGAVDAWSEPVSVQAESGIDFNPHRPQPAYSDQMPDGRLPYA